MRQIVPSITERIHEARRTFCAAGVATLLGWASLAVGGCVHVDDAFPCTASTQCAGPGASCQAGWCSSSDSSCGSGLRYDGTAGPKSGQCVGGGDLGSSDGSDGSDLGSTSDGGPSAPATLSVLAGKIGGKGTADGPPALSRVSSPASIVGDGSGKLYFTDGEGQTVRAYDPGTGLVATLAGFPRVTGAIDGSGSVARFSSPQGITYDGQGMLYVSDANNASIRRIEIATQYVTTIAGGASAGLFIGPQSLAYDATQSPALFVSDTGHHAIRRVDLTPGNLGQVTTFAGTLGQAGSTDAVGGAATFNGPEGIVSDGAGKLYVVDTGNSILRTVTITSGQVTTIAGTAGSTGLTNGSTAAAQFHYPSALTLDAGIVTIADSDNYAIRQVKSGSVSTLAGSPSYGYLDATGILAQFNFPTGISVMGNGFLVSDTNNQALRVVTNSGVVTTAAGTPGSPGAIDDQGTAARFYVPTGVVSDGKYLYVSDSGNSIIRRVAADGTVTTLAGGALNQGATDGPVSLARFNTPGGLAWDGVDRVYVADTSNHAIRYISLSTQMVGTVAISGLSFPYGVACDGPNTLYVADTGHYVIRRVILSQGNATNTIIAGTGTDLNGGMYQSGDSDGSPGALSGPRGLALDREQQILYIADRETHLIRSLNVGPGAIPMLSTVAGNGSLGSEDGSGSSARFAYPVAVALDGHGNLFVADQYNDTVREIALGSRTVSTYLGKPHAGTVQLGLSPLVNAPAGLAFFDGGLVISAVLDNSLLIYK